MDEKNVKKPVKKTTTNKTTSNKTTTNQKTVASKTTAAKKTAPSKTTIATATKPVVNKKVDSKKATVSKSVASKVDTKKTTASAPKSTVAKKEVKKDVKTATAKSSVKPPVKKATTAKSAKTGKSNVATKTASKNKATQAVKTVPKKETTKKDEPKIETRKTEFGTITTERISASEVKKQHETKGISIVKIIICIVLIIALGFACNIIKKLSIINDLDAKFSKYRDSSNYYEKSIPDSASGIESIEVYKKDNVVKSILKSKTSGTITIINSRYGKRTFSDTIDGTKVMTYSSETDMKPTISILDFVSSSKWNNALFANISEEEVNGVKCFVFENLKNDNILYENGTKSYKVYIDKETGLVVQTIAVVDENGVESTKTTKYTYSFNNVSDDDVKSPNINEYEIRTK